MRFISELKDRIFSVSHATFDDLALEIFQYQAKNNPVYAEYLQLLKIKPAAIEKVAQIPFLPIQLFKSHKIVTGNLPENYIVFESSTTTGTIPSKHYVADIELYNEACLQTFELFFGDVKDYVFLALLPNYLERGSSSLVQMVKYFMEKSGAEESGFYIYDQEKMLQQIKKLQAESAKKIFIIGVSFALLDFAENFPLDLSDCIIMETGGMKGRRKELIRSELHNILNKAFFTKHIYSEYGMTELLSQAYAKENGIFEPASWMKVLIRDATDPFTYVENGQSGGVNIVDLANLHSCSFIQTQDVGIKHAGERFEILGRLDNADIRGCSLMYV
jgi:phenylacetate-coenzyme A ligase PaaK-like adenylate-forming protein